MLSVNTSQSIVECRFNLKFTEGLNRISIHNSTSSSHEAIEVRGSEQLSEVSAPQEPYVSVWMTCNLSPHFIMCHDAVNATLIHRTWNEG